MPLRDHFHTNSTLLNSEGVHALWPSIMVVRLNAMLPKEFVARPRLHISRAVLTHNHRDYKRLHAHSHPHGGIISSTRDDQNLPGLAQRIHDTISALPDLANRFVRIIRPNQPAKP